MGANNEKEKQKRTVSNKKDIYFIEILIKVIVISSRQKEK